MTERFKPVTTLDDLDSLDPDEILRGYVSGERGDPEPGHNSGRAFWHGWRCRMFDLGELQVPAEHRELVRQFIRRERERNASAN